MTRIRSGFAILLVVLPLLFAFPFPAAAQTPQITLLDAQTTSSIDFPNGIELTSIIESPGAGDIVGIDLLYRPESQETWRLAFVPAGNIDLGESNISASITLDLRSDFIPSGIELIAFWRLHMRDGSTQDTTETGISWIDPRFDWQTASTSQVNVHFYSLSPSFAQFIASTAQQTVDDLELRYELDQSEPIAIWMYANSTDFLETTPSNSREAVAGVSYPQYRVIAAIIGDGNTSEVGRTITHEISHQVLNQAIDNPYGPAPLWFDEGMATHTQTSGTTGYLPLAVYAATENQLFRLASLDSGFPFQANKASIAYAESWAVIEFIQQSWGDAGIARMIDAFAQGLPIDDVLINALGVDLDELDDQFANWLLTQAHPPAATPAGVQS